MSRFINIYDTKYGEETGHIYKNWDECVEEMSNRTGYVCTMMENEKYLITQRDIDYHRQQAKYEKAGEREKDNYFKWSQM